jgi:hypothetical protein
VTTQEDHLEPTPLERKTCKKQIVLRMTASYASAAAIKTRCRDPWPRSWRTMRRPGESPMRQLPRLRMGV